MSMSVLYESPVVIWRFEGILDDSEDNKNRLIDCFLQGLEYYQMSKKHEILWLNDTSQLCLMGAELQKMLDDFVNENIIDCRLSGKVAFLQPLDTIGKATVKFYVECARNRFYDANIDCEIEIFQKRQDADAWLRQLSLLKTG